MKIDPFLYPMNIEAEASVNHSESVEKVMQSVENILTNTETLMTSNSKKVHAKASGSECLEKIYRQILEKQARGVARRLLSKNIRNDSSWLYFNKQAAYVGRISICEKTDESPLGPIKITFRTTHITELIDWIAKP